MMWSLLTQLDTQIDVPSDTAYFFLSGREILCSARPLIYDGLCPVVLGIAGHDNRSLTHAPPPSRQPGR
jgi:hypothetical protein